jgi:hypothetical protein
MTCGWYLIVSRKNSLNGDFAYGHPVVKYVRHVSIKNFQQDARVNSELFDLALEYAN